eukprot:gene31814-41289_t
MPKFNAEEQEELRRILDGEDSLDNSFEGIRFSDLDDFDEPTNRTGKQINTSVGKSGEWSKQTAKGSRLNPPRPPPPAQQQSPPAAPKARAISPNADWRSALDQNNKRSVTAGTGSSVGASSSLLDLDRNRRDYKRPPVKAKQPEDDFSFTDLDYDDFEQAMREEDNAGLGSLYGYGGGFSGGKSSSSNTRGRSKPGAYRDNEVENDDDDEDDEVAAQVVAEKLLMSGDSLLTTAENRPSNIQLKDINGTTVALSTVFKTSLRDASSNTNPSVPQGPRRDIIVIYVDPRRMNDEFKTILKEFGRLPTKLLSNINTNTNGNTDVNAAVSRLLAVNCDDSADQRKFLKKNAGLLSGGLTSIMSDPTKQFMDLTKCRTSSRLKSALFLVEAATGKVLKVWYEPDWDPLTTKDLLVEEITLYRQNPRFYLQSQLGIR